MPPSSSHVQRPAPAKPSNPPSGAAPDAARDGGRGRRSRIVFTEAMTGVPLGTSLAAIQDAYAQVGRKPAVIRDRGADLGRVCDTEAGLVDGVAKHLAGGTRAGLGPAYLDEARADLTSYTKVQVASLTARTAWDAGTAVALRLEDTYQATAQALRAQGLTIERDGAMPRPDAEAIGAESEYFADGLADAGISVARPDDGAQGEKIAGPMTSLRAAVDALSAATLGQRAREREREADEAEAGGRGGTGNLLGDIVSFIAHVGKAVGVASTASVGAVVLDVAKGVAKMVGASDASALYARVEALRAQMRSDEETEGWVAIGSAILQVREAQMSVQTALGDLERNADRQTSDLANAGAGLDDRAAGGEPRDTESQTAIGRHLGEVLAAQTATAGARAAMASANEAVCSAVSTAYDASTFHGDPFLAELGSTHERATHVLTGTRDLGALSLLQYDRRMAALTPAVGQIARQLGGRSERGASPVAQEPTR